MAIESVEAALGALRFGNGRCTWTQKCAHAVKTAYGSGTVMQVILESDRMAIFVHLHH